MPSSASVSTVEVLRESCSITRLLDSATLMTPHYIGLPDVIYIGASNSCIHSGCQKINSPQPLRTRHYARIPSIIIIIQEYLDPLDIPVIISPTDTRNILLQQNDQIRWDLASTKNSTFYDSHYSDVKKIVLFAIC